MNDFLITKQLFWAMVIISLVGLSINIVSWVIVFLQKKENQHLRTQVAKIKTSGKKHFSNLREENKKIRDEFSELQTQNENLDIENSKLTKSRQRLSKRFSNLKAKNIKTEEENSTLPLLKEHVATLGNENEELIAKLANISTPKKKYLKTQTNSQKKTSASENNIKALSTSRPSCNIEFDKDSEKAFSLLNGTEPCVFVTGKAGTGKSTLLKCFTESTLKEIVLLAPTGVAAINIGGQSIHSFFGFPPRPLTDEDIKLSRNSKIYQALDTIIIDEISMVRADLLDGIDKFLKKNRGNDKEPFGGVQMIFFGDLYQLPPIVSSKAEKKFFSSEYKSHYFFDAKIMENVKIKVIELQKVYRQKEKGFIDILNAIRINKVSTTMLKRINQRHKQAQVHYDTTSVVTLATTNKRVAKINDENLEELPFDEITFQGVIEGEFPEKNLPTDLNLTLKQNAQVMFIKNDRADSTDARRWVNGTHGKITKLSQDTIEVEVSDEDGHSYTYKVMGEEWEMLKYKFDYETKSIKSEKIGSFHQYPLKLAWAMTIHKSQGKTIEKAHIDFGRGTFAHGQAYVAFSRCTSLDGITLERPITKSDIIVDATVTNFYKSKTHQ